VLTAGWVLLTLGLWTSGGWASALLGLPAPWLAGSMMAVAAAALAGVPVSVPAPLRNAAFALLGASMGAAVTPETVAQMRAWPLSIAILAASVVATMLVASSYLERVHGWDRPTARFSSVPGALTSVLILAATSSADLPRVAVAQSIRLFTLVALMPSILNYWGGSDHTAAVTAPIVASAPDVIATLVASAGGAAALAWLRVPGGVLLGAMVASAVLHGSGLAGGRLPLWLMVMGFIATGAVIGTRFRGTRLGILRSTLPGAFASVLLALVVSALFAAGGHALLGLPFGQLWLALAPGGVEAMAVMALALQLDPAFVGAHHVLRILGLNVTSPIWGRSPRPRPGS
jgi:membrane AbrB-like protein